jgi:hypothetical protein
LKDVAVLAVAEEDVDHHDQGGKDADGQILHFVLHQQIETSAGRDRECKTPPKKGMRTKLKLGWNTA